MCMHKTARHSVSAGRVLLLRVNVVVLDNDRSSSLSCRFYNIDRSDTAHRVLRVVPKSLSCLDYVYQFFSIYNRHLREMMICRSLTIPQTFRRKSSRHDASMRPADTERRAVSCMHVRWLKNRRYRELQRQIDLHCAHRTAMSGRHACARRTARTGRAGFARARPK